eukprot:181395-Rhodomonas_salina.1
MSGRKQEPEPLRKGGREREPESARERERALREEAGKNLKREREAKRALALGPVPGLNRERSAP